MEDELEDKLFYQTYQSHMKMLSKISLGLSVNHPIGYLWKLMRFYFTRLEVILCGVTIIIFLMYMQTFELWGRSFFSRISYAVGKRSFTTPGLRLLESKDSIGQCWELKETNSAAYALKGRRPQMEDRFVINENIGDSGVSLFAIFDGHGGHFAAEFAKTNLTKELFNKITVLNNLKSGKITESELEKKNEKKEDSKEKIASKEETTTLDRKKSFKKTCSSVDDCVKKEVTDVAILNKLNLNDVILRLGNSAGKSNAASSDPVKENKPLSSYIEGDKINYGKLITDEVLFADKQIIAEAKKSYNVAGTTALIAILEKERLTVANVGDSRGVMCDWKGNAIPLSFDHKPQQMREQKRIKEAGGYIAFHGVWRVAGILATSRALGDYPLKDKKYVIADPDVLTFSVSDHKPLFVILASDGLWDTFSNEEAVAFIKERLDEEDDFGAKSLVLQSYYKGSFDNISIIIINMKNRQVAAASSV